MKPRQCIIAGHPDVYQLIKYHPLINKPLLGDSNVGGHCYAPSLEAFINGFNQAAAPRRLR
jgi:hypothetical protein